MRLQKISVPPTTIVQVGPMMPYKNPASIGPIVQPKSSNKLIVPEINP